MYTLRILLVFLTHLLWSDDTFAQSVSTTRHHANKHKSYAYSFVHLTDTHLGEGIADYGTKGFYDEAPEGDVGYSAERLRKAVNWINKYADSLRIKFVIVSGDLTDSGERSEFLKAKEILDALKIPYIPMIGNHDVWSYTLFDEAVAPLGDSLLNTVFQETFEKLQNTFPSWDNGTRLNRVWNPVSQNFNYLQNYSFRYGKHTFILSDWGTRIPAKDELKGVGPLAEAHDFENGTFSWMNKQLADEKDKENVFVFSHHPLTPFIRNWFSFPDKTYRKIAQMLLPHKNKIAYWFSGHYHRDGHSRITSKGKHISTCVETGANKKYKDGHFRLVKVWE